MTDVPMRFCKKCGRLFDKRRGKGGNTLCLTCAAPINVNEEQAFADTGAPAKEVERG